jgi:hypothetical protein
MTAPSYTTDLTTLADGTGETWTETSTWTAVFAITDGETDAFIQGDASTSCTAKTGIGCLVDQVTGFTLPTDGAVLVWLKWDQPNLLEPESNGGIGTYLGTGTGDGYRYNHLGGDSYTYGGWVNLAMADPAANTYDATLGSPGTTWTYAGGCFNATSVPSKGNPFYVDAVREGRCQIFAVDGDANGYATFAGMATENDEANNRWGLFQAIDGGYLWKGLMSLGNTTNQVDFRDQNIVISIQDTKKCTENFNKIEISNTSSRVDWTSVSISALGSTSRGNFEVVDDCDVNFDTCTFTDMGTFEFKASSDVLGCTFRRCLAVDANGAANMQSSTFAACNGAGNTSALIWDNNTDTDGKLDGCSFFNGATNTHALELGNNSPTTVDFNNITFDGYNTANGTSNSAVHVKRTTGTVTINISGGDTPTILTEGATVSIVAGSVTVSAKSVDATGANVASARVFLRASSGTGPFPYQNTVTITNSGTTATIAHASHGLATNDKVVIDGASHWQNNGVFQITVPNTTHYTCTLPSAPGSDPTGSITSTFVALEGLTDTNGDISTSRVYSSNQPVTGWIRKSTSSPYYKTAPISGTVTSSGGFSGTGVLISDE